MANLQQKDDRTLMLLMNLNLKFIRFRHFNSIID